MAVGILTVNIYYSIKQQCFVNSVLLCVHLYHICVSNLINRCERWTWAI